ncbi:PspC domain-containing protein [Chryseolinea sp. T2]|uniref:PspC domain-containing protein n=1 Tax=Chryseolinea sp. T2 TaxID=3129255 RepID=UPI003077F8E7
MKKNISINISGIIFHIEEDGYENLRKYLDSINKYFASFEDSSEILADIESRVAEIFLSKLNEGKQVITSDDVNSLITTMGSVSDFKAAEEQELREESTRAYNGSGTNGGQQQKADTSEPRAPKPPQQLFRDQKRKIVGGVCSGIANYLGIDAVWIRLIFGILAFAYGLTIIVYLIMWAVVPGSFDLDEPESVKRMFRDGEKKVIGGVSGGVAAYFGLDIILVRVLFIVFTFFFGVGFAIYIVLWIALPEARTITDRMEMQGEPVTLSNIESNIKRNLNVDQNAEESTLTKILLFPFRLIGMVLSALGKILVPLLEVIRVAIGIVILLMGVGFILTAIIAGGVFLGLFSASAFSWPAVSDAELAVPMQAFLNVVSGWMVFAAFLAVMIPAVLVTMLGASIAAKKYLFSPTVGWTMFVLFFVSVAMLSVTIPKVIYAFKEEGDYEEVQEIKPTGKKLYLRVNEVGMDDYDGVHLTIEGTDEREFKIVKTFSAKGSTRQKGIENAKMINYGITVNDSVLVFDSNIRFDDDAVFRAQRVDVVLRVPRNYPFVLDESASRLVSHWIDWDQRDDNTWEMTEKGLTCITCPIKEEDKNTVADEGLTDFDEVDIRGIFDVRITQGGDYKIEMIGSESEKAKYKIVRLGKTLIIDYTGTSKKFDWSSANIIDMDEMRINITMPNLKKIEAEGVGSLQFERFDSDDLAIELRGPVKLRGEIQTQDLVLHLTGKSEVELSGHAQNLDAELQFASKLKAYNLEVQDALIEVNGASTAKVNVSQNLEIEEGLASDVDYRGHPNVTKRD